MASNKPVAGQKKESGEVSKREGPGVEDAREAKIQKEDSEVEGPDSQNPPGVESPETNGSCALVLFFQQFCDQKGAEKKEETDAEGARTAKYLHEWEKLERGVVKKNQAESHGAKNVQFRPIKAGVFAQMLMELPPSDHGADRPCLCGILPSGETRDH